MQRHLHRDTPRTSMINALRQWASSFSELRTTAPASFPMPRGDEALAYRLKHWPLLEEAHKTAGVYRVLSVMSSRPVNRGWMLAQSRLAPHELDGLLLSLKQEGAIQIIDISKYPQQA